MEAEKSRDLLSISQGPGKPSGIICSESRGLRTKGSDAVNSGPSVKIQKPETPTSKGRRRWVSQLKPREQIHPSPTFLFSFFRPWTDWIMPTRIGECDLLSLQIQMGISSGNTLTEIPRNNVLPAIWASLSPVKWTYKSKHHKVLYSVTWSLMRIILFFLNIFLNV